MIYVCTHSDSDMIFEYGEGKDSDSAKNQFFELLECNDDYEKSESIEWSVYERVELKDFLCNNICAVYLDGILEDLFDESSFDDIWPSMKQSDKLESMIIGTIKNWVRNNPEFDRRWQCGDLIDSGVYIKGMK